MLKELEYPFDSLEIIKKKRSYKKELLSDTSINFIEKKIAILGGSTTENIKNILELFLLNYGIKPVFYESEYNKFYEDGMFPNPALEEFHPDIIYICTCIRNINDFPIMSDSLDEINYKKNALLVKFYNLWDSISTRYHCPIIQNNFEYPFFRLMGNKDASDYHGRVNFVTSLNCAFYEYANSHDDFYICDLNYISASYGLEKWSDPYYWNMYKYAVAVPAIPYLSFDVAKIIKSLYGKNKKVFNLDLDNTLWGGIIGDDGADNIEIGKETPLSQIYSEFQEYIKLHKQLGVLLTINSKNDEEVALSGFDRPDSILKRDDFVDCRINWDPKSNNLKDTAIKLGLLPESFVFVDDNAAERDIVKQEFNNVSVPEMDAIENYIKILDKSGFFEITTFSNDDVQRNRMYVENSQREEFKASFVNYQDYLSSLNMKGEIQEFSKVYMSRIAQLTNKSNQFNLTTQRYTQSEIESIASDENHITLYGKLEDKFGDNGVVSVVIGRIDGEDHDELHMELWLMSCRVLKRDMEYAMMDELIKKAKNKGIKTIYGYYYPSAKNSMVKNFYELQGFTKINEDSEGNTVWKYVIGNEVDTRQNVIRINE